MYIVNCQLSDLMDIFLLMIVFETPSLLYDKRNYMDLSKRVVAVAFSDWGLAYMIDI
jgi:hypothetical protein